MTKVTQLPEDTTPLHADLLLTVDDPDGTPVSKKATIANVIKATDAKGEIYIYAGIEEQTGIAVTPVKLTLFNTAQGFNGLALNMSPDKSQNRIVVGQAGSYVATLFLAAIGTANTEFAFEIFVNSIATKRAVSRSTGSATSVMSVSVGGTFQLDVGDIVEIYVASDNAAADLTVKSAQFIVAR